MSNFDRKTTKQRDAKYSRGKRLNYTVRNSESKIRSKVSFRDTKITVSIKERPREPYLIGKH